jgi:hypothetical protein
MWRGDGESGGDTRGAAGQSTRPAITVDP